MATIKLYADLQQSKKLAEILPLESADMLFQLGEDKYADSIRFPLTKEHWKQMMPDINPCWSLTALLNVLPRVDIEKEICSDDTYDYRVKAYIGDGYIGDWYDNPVDAAFEMILKLNELKML